MALEGGPKALKMGSKTSLESGSRKNRLQERLPSVLRAEKVVQTAVGRLCGPPRHIDPIRGVYRGGGGIHRTPENLTNRCFGYQLRILLDRFTPRGFLLEAVFDFICFGISFF